MPIPAVPSSPSLDATPSVQDSSSSNVATSDHGDAFAQAMNQASAQQDQQDATESAHSRDGIKPRAHSKSDTAESKPATDTKATQSSASSKSASKSKPSDDDTTKPTTDQSTPTATTSTPNPIVAPVVVPDIPIVTLPTTDAATAADAAAVIAQATATPVATNATTPNTTPTGKTIDIVLTDPTTAAGTTTATAGAGPQPVTAPGQANSAATTPVALPDQSAFSQALSQVVTQQVATQTSSLATDAKAIADGTKSSTALSSADLAGKAIQDLATSLQTNTASTAIADTAAKDVTAPAPSAPLTQLVSVVQPLRAQGNGDYQLTLQLHPDTLGKVEVSVSLHDGQISMQLSSDNADARQMLRQSMDDLRQQLESSGLSTGSLDVGTGDTTDRQTQAGTNGNTNSASIAGDEVDDAEFFSRLSSVTSVNPSDGSLDVRV